MSKSRGRTPDNPSKVYSTDARTEGETPQDTGSDRLKAHYSAQGVQDRKAQAEGSEEAEGHPDSGQTRNRDGRRKKRGQAETGQTEERKAPKGKQKRSRAAESATPAPETNGSPPAAPPDPPPVDVLPAESGNQDEAGSSVSNGEDSSGPRQRQPAGQGETADGEELELEGFRASELNEGEVEWLWKDRLPMNTVAFFQGDKGQGKSTWARAIAACMTGGPLLPGMEGEARFRGDVLWFAGEENLQTRVRPGLRVAGADLAHCHLFSALAAEDRALELPRGLHRLAKLVRRHHAKLVLIDPLFMFTDGSLNLEGPTGEGRAFMRKMLAFAADEGVLVLFTRNLTKRRADGALAAGRGGGELGNAARAVLHVGEFAKSPGIYGLAVAACNDGRKVPALVYQVTEVDGHGRIVHLGEQDVTADELLAGADAFLDRCAKDRAKRLIRQMIPSGYVDSKIIKAKAESVMCSIRTMQAAAEELGVQTKWEGHRADTVCSWGPPEGGWK